MAKAKKVSYEAFKLSTVAGRIGLLGGITAGTVDISELQHAMVADTEQRAYRKPVVVPGYNGEVRFSSVRNAAKYLLTFGSKKKQAGWIYALQLNAMEKRIARYCNADNMEGYYWSE